MTLLAETEDNPQPSRKPLTALSVGISLKASLGYSFGSQVFFLLSQLGMLSALAHFRGPVAVGEYGLALALTTPLFLLMNMGFRTAQAVDVDEAFSFADYGGTRIILTGVATVISILLAAIFAQEFTTFVIVVVVAFAKAFESISNLAFGAYQQAGRMDMVASSFATRSAITLVGFLALLLLGADTATALLAQLVTWAAFGVFFDYPRASRLVAGRLVFPRWSIRDSWRLLCHSAPLGGGLLANALQMTVARLLVERFVGLEALGLFTSVAYFQQAGVSASNSVSNAIVNRLARLSRTDQRAKLRRILLHLFLLFTLVGAAGIAICYYFGDLILLILFGFGAEHQSATQLLLVISIVVGLRMISSLPQSLMFAEQRFKEFMGYQLFSLALTAVLGYILIPRYGILGAGYVLLVAAFLRLVILELVVLLFPRGNQQDTSAASTPEQP
jgi:O-antigen/teichoic acid export membrane protein